MKIVFITYHNWQTKRHGGFHALAEYACRVGHSVVFLSFSRPLKLLRINLNDERLNKDIVKKLIKGVKYRVGDKYITNVTWPTISLWGKMRRYAPKWLNDWMDYNSFIPFWFFSQKWLKGTNCFVLESNESIMLYDKLRKYHPHAMITYRPSDPIIDSNPSDKLLCDKELDILPKFDMSFIPNEEGVQLYRDSIPNFDDVCKCCILPNGVYLEDYQRSYSRPSRMKDGKSVTYIGVENIEWQLVIEAATQLSSLTFYIIMPTNPPKFFLDASQSLSNLVFISGIPHSEVPAWVINSDVLMSPLYSGCHEMRKSLHLTAKNIKPIAAKKPCVTYCNNPLLAQYGITTTYTYSDFIFAIKQAIEENGRREYNFDLKNYDWNIIGQRFLSYLVNRK